MGEKIITKKKVPLCSGTGGETNVKEGMGARFSNAPWQSEVTESKGEKSKRTTAFETVS